MRRKEESGSLLPWAEENGHFCEPSEKGVARKQEGNRPRTRNRLVGLDGEMKLGNGKG